MYVYMSMCMYICVGIYTKIMIPTSVREALFTGAGRDFTGAELGAIAEGALGVFVPGPQKHVEQWPSRPLLVDFVGVQVVICQKAEKRTLDDLHVVPFSLFPGLRGGGWSSPKLLAPTARI